MYQSCIIITFSRPSITILLMILLPPWQSKFCPRLCIKQGHCCRPRTLPLTSIGSTRHFWHSSNCWGRDGIWDKVTNLQTVSHNTSVCASYLAHPLPVPLSVQSANQFCVLSVQPGHHITSQPSPSLFMKPRAPSPWTLIPDTKLQRNRQFVFLSDPCNSQQTSPSRLRSGYECLGWILNGGSWDFLPGLWQLSPGPIRDQEVSLNVWMVFPWSPVCSPPLLSDALSEGRDKIQHFKKLETSLDPPVLRIFECTIYRVFF